MSNQMLVDALSPVLDHLDGLDLSDARAARESLNAAFPPGGDVMRKLAALCDSGRAEGWLCTREAGASRFSRVAKADAARGFSIDAVLLSGDGVWHRHTRGEINCMFNVEGAPKFCGFEPGWAVFPPGSEHVPAVTDGSMMILYFLPGGEVEWKRG